MKYVLYWKTGKKEIVEGGNITQAFTSAGYSTSALMALDFYSNDDYIYKNGKWQKKGKKCKKCGEIKQVYENICYDCYGK